MNLANPIVNGMTIGKDGRRKSEDEAGGTGKGLGSYILCRGCLK